MTKLDISKNGLRAEGGRALAVGLKGNQVMTELNIAGNQFTKNACGTAYDDMSGVAALTGAIKDMRALSTVILHKFPLPIQEIKAKAELDLSSKELGIFDAIVIAALLPLNVSGTMIVCSCCR
jgi:hypothetical protein